MKQKRKWCYNESIRRISARPLRHRDRSLRMPSFSNLSLTSSDIDRFWSKVEKSQECWIWTAAKTSGRGVFNIRGTVYSAAKLSVFIETGRTDFPVPVAVNSCGKKECINPEHLDFCSRSEIKIGNRLRHNAAISKRKPILYEEVEGVLCAFIPVGPRHYAIVDIEDVPKVEHDMWQYSRGYAVHRKVLGFPSTRMHRILIDVPNDLFIDHVNGNRLDNRKLNLRDATPSQNGLNNINLYGHNISGKTGVSWHDQNQKWVARIVVRGEVIGGGTFFDINEAIRSRMDLESKHCGEFAPKRRPLYIAPG